MWCALFGYASAAPIDDMRRDIDAKKSEIQKLEEEAKQFRLQIETTQKTSKTLSSELKRLDRVIASLKRDITITEQKIKKTGLEINVLDAEINDKVASIDALQGGLASLLQAVARDDAEPSFALILRYRVISEFFSRVESLTRVKEKMLSALDTVKLLREELFLKRADAAEKKRELESLESTLAGRKQIQDGTKKEKSTLLAQTKNQEKVYQTLLTDRERKRRELEEEVADIENQIRITIDPSLLPAKQSGVLGSPLEDVSLVSCWGSGANAKNCLTQFFGNTDFAATGAYNGKGHNGVDFRASVGARVLSAEAGVVEAVGDTDVGCMGASYGKWILVKHTNNLSTLYAHLSGISVRAGQSISRGSPIGFSGRSGYATGPHLHFGVYATQAVRVESIKSKVCGRMMTLPISPHNGYLNPLDYL